MNDEDVWIWKETEVAYLKVLIQCSAVVTDETKRT
jgi:hypothetical protein